MPETLLLLDLGAQEASVDLHAMTQIVLSDSGATIQILRLAGRERVFGEERPSRVEDCISVLGVQPCIEAVFRRPVSRAKDQPAIMIAWQHAREIAETCKLMAEELPECFGSNEAYLIGMLHELGSLPAILGWAPALAVSSDPIMAGLKMAEEWFLPQCLVDYFSDLGKCSSSRGWARIVQRAHEVSGASIEEGSPDPEQDSQIPAFGKS